MLKKRHNFIIISIVISILLTIGSQCFAAVTVTQENLSSTFQQFITSSSNDGGYTASVENNIISISADGEKYEIKYDLTNKPTFSLEVPITKGMSYSDFEAKTGNILLPMLGYIAVANIQGVEFEDSTAYFSTAFLSSAFSSNENQTISYTIIDDLNGTDGVTVDSTDSNTIYTSQFGDKVIEYVNDVYKNKQTMTDSSTIDGINSYVWTIERTNITDTSCTLLSSLSVNIDADFSKIKGYADNVEDDINISSQEELKDNTTIKEDNTIINDENENENETITNITVNETSEDKDLPQTGITENLSIIIAISIVFLIISVVKFRKYKDLK